MGNYNDRVTQEFLSGSDYDREDLTPDEYELLTNVIRRKEKGQVWIHTTKRPLSNGKKRSSRKSDRAVLSLFAKNLIDIGEQIQGNPYGVHKYPVTLVPQDSIPHQPKFDFPGSIQLGIFRQT